MTIVRCQYKDELSSHARLKTEHQALRKKYDDVKRQYHKLHSSYEELRAREATMGPSRVFELEQCLKAECKLNEELKIELESFKNSNAAVKEVVEKGLELDVLLINCWDGYLLMFCCRPNYI
jgi:predicted RNase H-like nuclease (RuvC/YqgF family)